MSNEANEEENDKLTMKAYGSVPKGIPIVIMLLLIVVSGVFAQTSAPAPAVPSPPTSAAPVQTPASPPALAPAAPPPVKSPEKDTERFVSIDFNNVNIEVFIKFIAELTGKNFIIDQRVKGKVTIISPSKISVAEAYAVFESVLEVYGFASVKSGEVTKIIPSPDARTKNIQTLLQEEAVSPDDKVITQLIPLKYADPEEVKRLFAPLISKNSVLLSYAPTNMLIITDVYSNIQRLLRILKTIDVVGVGQEIEVMTLEYADATKLVKTLTSVFQSARKRTRAGTPAAPGAAPGAAQTVQFVADERTNMLVVIASEDDMERIKKLIKILDKEMTRGKANIHVYYLENAVAEDLAKVLQSLQTKKPIPTAAPGAKKDAPAAPVVSEQTFITADKATNSLIILADMDDYQIIEEIIKKLDSRRPMVYIECLIMEVNADKGFSLGVEYLAAGKTDFDSRQGVFGGGFSGTEGTGYPTLGSMMLGALPSGFSLGVFSEKLKIGDLVFPNLGAVVNAYKKDKDVHILSTPQILTKDNQEASITIGKNVPYQTKSGVTGTTYETYNTYEYKDVGITLKITPQISKDRLIHLKIFQEVTKLESSLTVGAERPTTLKRTINTTVVVNDKNTIAIGGLIDDSIADTEYKVPCLGDTPGLEWLFKSMTRTREKTNLFVFLTPHVIETPQEAESFYKEKKDQIDRFEDFDEIKMYKKRTDENGEPITVN